MNEQILIVDDEVPIRRLLEKMFCNEYKVFCAADGFEALEIVRTNDISLVISDQRMPGMSGVELLEKIRFSHPQTARILLSGYIEKDDLRRALENGLICKFVSKPWSIRDLKAIVAEAVQIKGQNQIKENLPLA